MDLQLSNALSHAFFRVLDAKIHHTWWKCFLPIFRSTLWEWVNAIFTLYWFLKWHYLLPKGQQKLTTFSDLIDEGLSYLQLFLEPPETSWSHWNITFIWKSPKTGILSLLPFTNLTSCLIYEAKTQVGLGERGNATGKVVIFYIWTILKRPDNFWKL